MKFKTLMLIFYSVIIIFCFTLYFQPDENIRTFRINEYKSLPYSESRSHSLQEFNKKIAPIKVQDLIGEMLEKNRLRGEKTRVMELGFGNGRVLMELKKIYPEVEFYGINKEKTVTFYRRESFILTALKFNIMTKEEVEEIILPYVVFKDLDFGAKIPYDDEKFDLVFSQSTLPHIRYSFELLNETMRILKPGGMSIHSDFTANNIFSKGVMINLKEAATEIRRSGLEFYVLENPESIKVRKNSSRDKFNLTPHHPIPANINELNPQMRLPEMSYNLN